MRKTELTEARAPKKRPSGIQLSAVILSLILAIGFWLYVIATDSPTGEGTVDASVTLVGTDTLSGTFGYSVLTGYDNTAEITLRGRQREIDSLRAEDLIAKIDLTDITQPGSYQKKVQVTPPTGMEVVRISPEYITVEVDVEKTVNVPVLEPEDTYTLEEGVKFRRSYSTQTISVKGPQTVVDKIYGVRCQVELGEFVNTVTKTVPVRFVDEAGQEIVNRYLVPSQSTLSITYTLYKEKTVPLVLDVQTLLSGERVTGINVNPATITVQGAPEQIDALEQIVAKKITTADMTGMTSTFTGTVTLPDGLTSPTGAVTYEASARVYGCAQTRVTVPVEQIHVFAPESLEYSIKEASVSVNVRTTYAAQSQIDSSALVVTANLSSFTEDGTYPVELLVSVAEDKQNLCYVVGTATVTVRLSK